MIDIAAATAALTLEEKCRLVAGETNWRTKAFPHAGIPQLKMSDGPTGESLPIRLAEETAHFISQNGNQPFLAFLSFDSVHGPIQTSLIHGIIADDFWCNHFIYIGHSI